MHKLFLLLFLAVCFVDAKQTRYSLYAPTLYTEGDLVIAEGGVVIYNGGSTFSASKIIYDQKNQILELFDDVYVSYKDGQHSQTDHIKLDLKSKKFDGEELFLYDELSGLWIKSNRAKSSKRRYILRDSQISSCDVSDPDWQFKFSKGVYYPDREFVSLTHARFYAGKIPLLYFPWLAFPTNDKRESGLLRPFVGFESSENLLFVQPIYIAPRKNWDIELDPQIRLGRGVGLYSTLRFVDTNHSKGSVRYGFFKEKKGYAKEHNLKNDTHSGFEVKYENSSVISDYFDSSYKDGLLIDFTGLNDIDYINLKHDGNLAVNKLVTSKINYTNSNEVNYFGLYAKYFIDTEKLNNDDTLQTLPSFQYHKFLSEIKDSGFLYSVDLKFKNSYTKVGLRARQSEISLPLIYNKTFFDDFINFSASENLYYSRVNYFEENSSISDANYFSNYHRLSLSSDLTKKYSINTHNIQLGISYIIPSFDKKSGYFADFIPFNLEKKSLQLRFNEYLYDDAGFGFLTHRIRQNIYLEDKENTLDDLENELIYRFNKDFYVSNTLIYSHEYDKLKKIQSGLYYRDKLNMFKFNHTYQKAPNLDTINFVSTNISRKVDRRYEIFAGVDYDFEDSFTKEWRFGWQMKKRCWDYQLRYKQSITPSLTSGGTRSITRRGVYLFVRLANIGATEIKTVKEYSLGNDIDGYDLDEDKDKEESRELDENRDIQKYDDNISKEGL
jgi:LPS-assembly protein